MNRDRATARNAMLLAASVMVWCGGASATPSCQGTYAATSLQPLPERVVVDLDIRDRSPRNLTLADRFLRGVREAGVAVGQDANVLLHVSTSRLGETSSGATRGAERTYSELGGLAGRWDAAETAADAYDGHEGVRGLHLRRSRCWSCGVDATVGKDTRSRLDRFGAMPDDRSPMRATSPKNWAVSSAARWGRGWSGRRSELSRHGRRGARGARGGGSKSLDWAHSAPPWRWHGSSAFRSQPRSSALSYWLGDRSALSADLARIR